MTVYTLDGAIKSMRTQAVNERAAVLPWGIGNKIGGSPEYQKLVEAARKLAKPGGESFAGLTRFDPSTKTRIPVTQEWVDEAVAEIVRLNVEIGNGLAQKASAMLSHPNQFAEDVISEQDRIWEAVRAASAV